MTPILQALLELLDSELPAIEAFVVGKLQGLDTSTWPIWEKVLVKLVIQALSAKAAAA